MDSLSLPLIEVKELPSKGLAYSRGVKIFYEPFSFGEVKRHSESKVSGRRRLLEIADGLKVEGMTVGQMTFADLVYVAFLKKLCTFGMRKFSVATVCKTCEKPQRFELGSDQIEFNEMEVTGLPVKVAFDESSVEFMPFTVGMCREIETKPSEVLEDVRVLAMMSNLPSDTAVRFIQTRFGEDAMVLNYVDSILAHGMKEAVFSCLQKVQVGGKEGICGGEITVDLEVEADHIILPFCGAQDLVKSRVSYGKVGGVTCAPSADGLHGSSGASKASGRGK